MASGGRFTAGTYDFDFEIAANDFTALLAGRQFKLVHANVGLIPQLEKNGLEPPAHNPNIHWAYRWDGPGAFCLVVADGDKTRVNVKFAAD